MFNFESTNDFMFIRKAKQTDVPAIAHLLLQAMEDIIYQFIGKKSKSDALLFLTKMAAQKSNQYSFENCWIVEENETVIAAANVYEGKQLEKLRAPIIETLQKELNQNFHFEDETSTGEIYIDSIGVDPQNQGRGLGSKLLQFLIDEYVNKKNQTLGLLVDKENPNAKKLYLKLGFEVVGEKILAGKEMEHLQIKK